MCIVLTMHQWQQTGICLWAGLLAMNRRLCLAQLGQHYDHVCGSSSPVIARRVNQSNRDFLACRTNQLLLFP